MKINQIVSRCVCIILFVYLIVQIFYLSCYTLPAAEGEVFEGLVSFFLVQSIVFAVCALAALIVQYEKMEYESPYEKLLLISGEGKVTGEILLQDRDALVITGKKNGKGVSVVSAQDAGPGKDLYGVCNKVCGCWYLEALSSARPIGLRHGSEGAVYKLKEGVPYPLSIEDMIYVNNYKIVMKQKNNLEGQNGFDSL